MLFQLDETRFDICKKNAGYDDVCVYVYIYIYINPFIGSHAHVEVDKTVTFLPRFKLDGNAEIDN